jgi:hypothetical protein
VIAPAVTVPLVFTLVTEAFPSWMVLLAATTALYPKAVALDKAPDPTSALYPSAVLLDPVVFD